MKPLHRLRYALRVPRTWRYLVTFQAAGRTGTTIVELGWKIRAADDLKWVQDDLLAEGVLEPVLGEDAGDWTCTVTSYQVMAFTPFRRPTRTESKYLRFA